ncbi:MAG: N-acetyltransferase family protein [Pseudobutyrivibrio sp.]|nr:N-acetyltransferase family protein [Pseudobutyrivibrio sp.]
MRIEKVQVEDAAKLLEIYGYYVANTAISFEYEIPTLEEFQNRIKTISEKYPYIMAVDEDGTILGYAYATAFKGRRAYDWSVESTIYIRKESRRLGLGRILYTTLEQQLTDMGILNMNACIALPKGEDPHLTDDSIRFHKNLGFIEVGVFHDSGFKFNTWYDMIWMEKMLGSHSDEPQPVSFGMF